MAHHRSRLCQFVIDGGDLDRAVASSAALDATEEPVSEHFRPIYRRLRLPDAELRVLLQRTDDPKVAKERMHLDLETDDVEAEVQRLEALALGATRWDHQVEHGYDFWVMRDPWDNEFCVAQPEFPELLARRPPTRRPRRRRAPGHELGVLLPELLLIGLCSTSGHARLGGAQARVAGAPWSVLGSWSIGNLGPSRAGAVTWGRREPRSPGCPASVKGLESPA